MLLWLASSLFIGATILHLSYLLLGHYQKKLNEIESQRLVLLEQGLSEEFFFIEPAKLKTNLRWLCGIGFIISLIMFSAWPIALCLMASWFFPSLGLRFVQVNRKHRFNRQLPVVLPAISSILKAGHTFERALETLSQTQPPPMSQELGLVLKQLRLGSTMEDALSDLSNRFSNRDLEIVIRAVGISRRVGSNLAEAFDRVAEMVRARSMLRDKLAGLTAQGKVQGWVAIAMPIGMSVVMSMMAPGYLSPLFNTGVGRIVLGVSALMLTVGGIWIHKISSKELME